MRNYETKDRLPEAIYVRSADTRIQGFLNDYLKGVLNIPAALAHRRQLLRLLQKEVKTLVSLAANLYGLCEEEHARGAMAFPTYVLGQDFHAGRTVSLKKASFRLRIEISLCGNVT